MVVVSHDRYFLDQVVTKIWELHDGKIEAYPGNFSQYWRLRTEKAKVLQRQSEKQQEYIADQEEYIRKYGAGQRAKQAQDREKKLARVERVETMREIVGPVMGFGEVDRSRRHRDRGHATSPRRTTSPCSRASTSPSCAGSASGSWAPTARARPRSSRP